MIFALLRLIGVIWFFGFIVLAIAATSSYLYSDRIESGSRASAGRHVCACPCSGPIALMSADGRARLRRG